MDTEAPQRMPWQRQPYETRKAYEAFAIYRDMGAARSLEAVAARLGKSTTLMSRWSGRWDWVNRVYDFDDASRAEAEHKAFEERVEQQLREQREREEEAKRTRTQARTLKLVGSQVIMEVGAALASGEHKRVLECEKCGHVMGTDRLKELLPHLAKAATAFDIGAKHERLEQEKPTEIVKSEMGEDSTNRLLQGFAEIIREIVPPALWDTAASQVDELLKGVSGNGKPS